MYIDPSDNTPIFIQIKEGLEEAILTGIYKEEDQVPSTTEISLNYQINPATALKGINELVDDSILYKKRGIGVFVKDGAVSKIKMKRQKDFSNKYLKPLIDEARRLSIEDEELITLLKDKLKNKE